MADVVILPFSDLSQLGNLFDRSISAEGCSGWFQCLAETTLESSAEAILAVARDGSGAVRAALPLVRIGNDSLRALTAPYTTLYAPALPEPQWARFLGAESRQYVSGSLRLDSLDLTDAGVAAYANGLASSGLLSARYGHFVNYFEPLAGFEEYWRSRPSRLRATVSRKFAQASKMFAVDFRCIREGAQMDEAMATYDEVYRASWKAAEPHPHFTTNMVRALSKNDFVRIGTMTLDGRPVAAQIWLISGRKATIFKLAHIEEAAAHSPGSLLTYWMISTLSREEETNEIDFGRGDDAYKRDWLTRSRLRCGLVAGNWKSRVGRGTIACEVWPTQMSNVGRLGLNIVGRILTHST